MGCLPGVFRYTNPANRIHVTEKPLQLMRDVVQICVPGGRILDPFAGAGTTVLASVLEGYEAVGIEITDAYYKLGPTASALRLERGNQRLNLSNKAVAIHMDCQNPNETMGGQSTWIATLLFCL